MDLIPLSVSREVAVCDDNQKGPGATAGGSQGRPARGSVHTWAVLYGAVTIYKCCTSENFIVARCLENDIKYCLT